MTGIRPINPIFYSSFAHHHHNIMFTLLDISLFNWLSIFSFLPKVWQPIMIYEVFESACNSNGGSEAVVWVGFPFKDRTFKQLFKQSLGTYEGDYIQGPCGRARLCLQVSYLQCWRPDVLSVWGSNTAKWHFLY